MLTIGEIERWEDEEITETLDLTTKAFVDVTRVLTCHEKAIVNLFDVIAEQQRMIETLLSEVEKTNDR